MKLLQPFLILVFSIFFSAVLQANGGTAVVTKEQTSENGISVEKYKFDHQVEYFAALEQRLLNYANRNTIIIQYLSISDFKCEVIFVDNISTQEKEETLLFLAQGLSFTDFTIE